MDASMLRLRPALRMLILQELPHPKHFAVLAAMACAMVGLSSHATIIDEALAQKVKAAFLYKFSGYVDWPPMAFDSPTSPFTLCVVDSSEVFNDTLREVVNGETVNGRPVVVRQINTAEEGTGCHILYIGTSDAERAAEVAEAVRGSSTLTVSDNASQGIIDFLIADNRVRFNINEEAAAENGLMISSKLLELAVNVRRRPKEDQ
jgi:hypothetical protein